jgi:hypothetical protein
VEFKVLVEFDRNLKENLNSSRELG